MGLKWSILLFLMVSFSFASSTTLLLEELNEGLQAGETFVSQLELDLKTNLNKDNLKIFEDRREVFFEKDVFSYNNLTFFYVIFPKSGNFSLIVDSFLFYSNNTLVEGSINHTVNVMSAAGPVLTLRPGIVFGSNLSIFLTNMGLENLSVKFQGNSSEVKSQESIRRPIKPEEEFFYLDVSSYRNFIIPVIYLNYTPQNLSDVNSSSLNLTNYTNLSLSELYKDFFNVSRLSIEANLTKNQTFSFNIPLVNLLNGSININISSNLKKITFNKTFELGPSEAKEFNFHFLSDNEGVFSGNLTFSFNKTFLNVPLVFYVLEDEESFGDFYQSSNSNTSCVDLGGELCEDNWECVGGNIRFLGGGWCCVGGNCVSPEELYPSPKKNYFVSILAILAAGVAGYFIYKKFKEVKVIPKF
jgi:hypothetical protein